MSDKKLLSKEVLKEMRQGVQEMLQAQTPLPGNKCHDCEDGVVVQKVNGCCSSRFFYSRPECNKCGRVYLNAGDVAKVGEQEFLKLLNEPFTI